MEAISIQELKRLAGPSPTEAVLHLQVEAVREKSARNGKPFYEVHLVDGTGQFVLRVFNDSAEFVRAQSLRAPCFVEIKGIFKDAGQFGIEAPNWETRLLADGEINELLAGSGSLREKQSADFKDIYTFVIEMKDPRIRRLCDLFFEKYGDRFKRTAAAREYHHARRGGLVEHVAQMMRSAAAISTAYKNLNKDLLLAGVLFHDCGKLWENCYTQNGFSMPYSEVAELLTHIPMGIEIVNKLWREVMDEYAPEDLAVMEPASEDVRLHLLHLIAAHHGEYEFGAPVLPKTPEALVLHHVDNIDAKMEMFLDGYAASEQLGKNIFKRHRPLRNNLVKPLASYDGES